MKRLFRVVRSAVELTSSNQGNDAILRYQGIRKENTSWIARLANLPDNLMVMIHHRLAFSQSWTLSANEFTRTLDSSTLTISF